MKSFFYDGTRRKIRVGDVVMPNGCGVMAEEYVGVSAEVVNENDGLFLWPVGIVYDALRNEEDCFHADELTYLGNVRPVKEDL